MDFEGLAWDWRIYIWLTYNWQICRFAWNCQITMGLAYWCRIDIWPEFRYCVDTDMDWHRIGERLRSALYWHQIDIGLTLDWDGLAHDWDWIGTWLRSDWHRTGIGLVLDYHRICIRLNWNGSALATIWPLFFSPDWHRIGIRLGCIGNVLASDLLIGQGLIFGWHFSNTVDSGLGNRLLDKGRHWIGIGLTSDWHRIGIGLGWIGVCLT